MTELLKFVPAAAYRDPDGNTYRAEKASNGMWVCVRTNPGGNRKGFKPVGAGKRQSEVQVRLAAWAAENNWKAVPK